MQKITGQKKEPEPAIPNANPSLERKKKKKTRKKTKLDEC